MLPAIGDFLKNTFGESLKRPLQPAGLFAAAIFLLLNFLFIFPALIDQGHPLALAVRDLGLGMQAVMVTVLALILAYLLLSISSSILKLMSGEAWGNSPWIGRGFRALELQRMKSLKREVWRTAGPDSDERSQRRETLFHLANNYPSNLEQVGPTALANALHATASALWDRYQIEMSVLWPHMETVVANQTAITDRIGNEKATLDFLLNLAFVLEVFALEHVAVRVTLRQWPEAVWSIGFLVLSWGFYQAAVGKARSWGAAVQLAFDLHRDDLRKALGIRPFRNAEDERQAWLRASRWLLWNEPPGDLLAFGEAQPKPTAGSALEVTSSSNASTTVAVQERVVEHSPEPATTIWRKDFLEYLLLVNDSAKADAAPGSVVIAVSDTRVPSIAESAKPTAPGWSCEVVRGAADAPDHLVWTNPWLARGTGRLLRYRLPVASLEARTNCTTLTISPVDAPKALSNRYAFDYRFELAASETTFKPDVTVLDDRLDPKRINLKNVICQIALEQANDNRTLYYVRTPATVNNQELTFKLPSIAAKTKVHMRYLAPKGPLAKPGPRLAALLQRVVILCGPRLARIPPPVGKTIDQQQYLAESGSWTADTTRWCWSILQLEAQFDASPTAVCLNNLACAWMWLWEWDIAERHLRNALSSEVSDVEYKPGALDARLLQSERHRICPASVKEAVDYNLELVKLARYAWARQEN